MNATSVLIIGGTGCLSSAIVKECLTHKFNVTLINRGNRISEIPDNVELIKSDRKNHDLISKSISNREFDAIIDFLCYTKEELESSFNFYKDFTKQYFFISSAAVVDFRKTKIGDENSPKVDERWDYSINKWVAEEKLRSLAKNSGTAITIIRPSVTYGDTRIPYGITPPYGKHGTIINRILVGKPMIRWNKGINLHNMMRVEDFAKLFVPLIGNPNAYNQEFNICSEKAYTFNEVLKAIEKKLNAKVLTVDMTPEEYAQYIPERRGELIVGRSTDCISTPQKVKRLVHNVSEEFSLEEGISKTIDAYIAKKWMYGIDYGFDGEYDYAIKDWCQKNHQSYSEYRLGFKDYLGNATLIDKMMYFVGAHKGSLQSKIYSYTLRILSRLKKYV